MAAPAHNDMHEPMSFNYRDASNIGCEMSVLFDDKYQPIAEISQVPGSPVSALLRGWLAESDDFDYKVWPEVDKEIKQHRVKFRNA